jgi:hypothetical protein
MRKRYIGLRFFLLPALLLWAVAAFGAGPSAKLLIQVKTLSGKPIDRAEVIVNFAEGRSVAKLGKMVRTSYDMRTNQDGEVKVPAIPQGKIKIMVSAKGYQTYGEIHEIREDEKTIEIKLNPPQPQYSAH